MRFHHNLGIMQSNVRLAVNDMKRKATGMGLCRLYSDNELIGEITCHVDGETKANRCKAAPYWKHNDTPINESTVIGLLETYGNFWPN